MDGNVLDEVLELERRLRRERQAEEARLAEQLTARQQELELRLAAESERQADERAAFLTEAQTAAQQEAAAILAAGHRYAARLDALDDEALRAVLRRHLPLLLPGEVR